MNRKSRALGCSLLVVVTVGASSAMSVSAKTGGHFVSEVSHTSLVLGVSPQSGDDIRISIDAGKEEIECGVVEGHGTLAESTASSFELSTQNTACHTVGSEAGWTLHTNECVAKLKVASGDPATTEQTSELICPAGNAMSSTHPGCTFTVPPQGNLNGLTYTKVTVNGKHALTIDVNIQYSIQFHAGVCVFLGTNHTATFSGSTILKGLDTPGEPVAITAT